MVEMLQFSGLGGDCNISHFITTRQGGVSAGAYASLNPGAYSGDQPEAVRINRERICAALDIPVVALIAPFQVHGCTIRRIDNAFLQAASQQQETLLQGVDALVTNVPGVCVGVTTADCVPILLYAPDQQVVAAVHAGWRGTVQQILVKTVNSMVEQYGCDPACLLAGIGPSIGQASFEVGDEVAEAFCRLAREMRYEENRVMMRSQSTGKAHIDLWEANRLQLLAVGLDDRRIEVSGICTYTHYDEFFSARRLGIQSGRILSAIQIKDKK